MSSVFKDMDQDDRLDTLERKVKKLERNANGEINVRHYKRTYRQRMYHDGDGIYG